ncbi:hypothetical protein Fmac_024155 [Flemingia macrophylla]|uniref:Uncharacterized protein n=1 Tax=Flemingia macrophylla TaxID=520843 RepID=A0ABD1LNL6_9FABA
MERTKGLYKRAHICILLCPMFHKRIYNKTKQNKVALRKKKNQQLSANTMSIS